ncbi:MAG: hypothetical protein ABTD50_09080 [Polyangiaceae bacterium]|jgi:hypothetical protein
MEGPDVPREASREPSAKDASRDSRDLGGYVLQAILRSGEGPAAPKAPEVNSTVIDSVRRKLEPRLSISLSQARARFVLSGAFAVPSGTELRSRADRVGHIVLWPGEDTYRIVEQGTLRALLGERRLDTAPLSPAEVHVGGEGVRRLNFRTHRVDISTRAAWATLELGVVHDLGEGGSLVCRLLLELMSTYPYTPACGVDEVPLHADLHWTTQGGMSFDVLAVARRVDLAPQDLAVPPGFTAFEASAPPFSPGEALVQKSDLTAFRTGPVDFPTVRAGVTEPSPTEPGLTLINSSDELHVAWLDGAPIAWVAPGARLTLPSLMRGRYMFQWRTFMGDSWETPSLVSVPGFVELGAADASGR